MIRFSHAISLGLAFSGLAACGAAPTPAPSAAADSAAPRDRLGRIVDEYWDERVPAGDPLSPQFMADSLAVERRFLADVLAVPRERLDADLGLTYDIFKRQRELDIEGLTYPQELLPINPFEGMPLQFAREAAATRQQPLKRPEDYENWLLRIDATVQWIRQAMANLREGMRRGYTSPRILMERTLPLLRSAGEDTPANVFYVPLRTMPESIKDPERTRLASALTAAVRDKLLPAYRELHDFIRNQYLPRAGTSVALSALPLGQSWYGYRVRRATDSRLTPNEIHAIGVKEVERIRARMLSLSAGPGPGAGAGAGAEDLRAQTLAALPRLFSALPQEVGGKTAPYPLLPAGMDIASFLQEAIPGRQYQAALQQEQTHLPKFRRFGSDPAFVEGWALYAASLGEELGLYRDDEARRAALLNELKCAVALVVDTGLHAKGWTRAQAVDYLRAQWAVNDIDADRVADRFAALPGDALACKMGELKIRALRTQAQQVLGERFDIREFHTEILKDGAMPLDILEAKMRRWMEARR